MDHLIDFTRRNTWAVILVAIICSFIFPTIGITIKPYLNYLLGTLMFLSCLDLKVSEILKSFTNLKSQVLVLLIVNFVSPTILFFLKDYFSPEIFLGLIIAAVAPAGRSAVFLSLIYGGIPIKALVVTSLSNVISPVTVPFLVWLYTHTTIKMDPIGMGVTIFWMVLIPLVAAYFFGQLKLGKNLNYISPTISTFIVFLIILGIISPIKNIVLDNLSLTLILLLVISLLIIIDFALGFIINRQLPDKITYGLSSSYKNYTMATILSISLFSPIVALPSIVYTIANNLLLIPFQLLINHPKNPPHLFQKAKNILLIVLSIGLTIYLSSNPDFRNLLNYIGNFGIFGAFLAGLLFASTFTVGIAGLLLINLSSVLNPFLLIFFAALGGVTTDYIIFKFIRHNVSEKTTDIFSQVNHHSHFYKLLHTPYFSWTLSIIGLIIIASPLPDELGVSLLGLSKTSLTRFLGISYLSHSIGMTILIVSTLFF